MIVIDVGCAKTRHADSLQVLADRFHPTVLYGFDPRLDTTQYGEHLGSTRLILLPAAAWTRTGQIGFHHDASTSRIADEGDPVSCYNLAAFIDALGTDGPVLLKLDAEGAEYPLLEHLIATDTHKRVERMLVEWHRDFDVGGERERKIRQELADHVTLDDWWL